MPRLKPHKRSEKELTSFGLKIPETSAGPGWPTTRAACFRKETFFVFGDRHEPEAALTVITKLPVSAEIVQDLSFVRESQGWFGQHDWVIARFEPDDDILAEMPTLRAWRTQSQCAVAPKKFARLVRGEA
jgi:hypothetical protein